MKKLLFTIAVLGGLYAGAEAQITIAPEAGLNMATMNMKVTDLAGGSFKYDTHAKAGAAAGVMVDIPLSNALSLQPGLLYEGTGTGLTATYQNPGGKWAIDALTLPVNIEYKTGHPGGNRFFAGVGPYIAYNISGKYTTDENQTYGFVASTGTISIGSTKGQDYIKKFDAGLGVNVGYMIALGLYLRAHYQLGLTNIDTYADAHDSYKTSAYGITLGYVLGAGRNKGKDRGAGTAK